MLLILLLTTFIPILLAQPSPQAPQPSILWSQFSCNTVKVRKEFRELTEQERVAYLSAVVCLRETPSLLRVPDSRSVYDDFVHVHMQNVPAAHNTAAFLPWHRIFLSIYEHALTALCNYTGPFPYWDWSYDSQSPHLSPLLSPTYFGGNGSPSSNYCLTTGVFANSTAVFPDPHCLQRQFRNGSETDGDMMGAQYSPIEMEWIVGHTTFDAFRRTLEAHPHNNVHNSFGGDLSGLSTSVNDPIFWLHHTNLDRWWVIWQKLHPDVNSTFTGNVDSDNPDANDASVRDVMRYYGMVPDVAVADTFLTEGGANGLLCYMYSTSIAPPNITDPLLQHPVPDDSLPSPRPPTRLLPRRPRTLHRRLTTPLKHHTPLPQTFLSKMYKPPQIAKIRSGETRIASFIDTINSLGWVSYAADGIWSVDACEFGEVQQWREGARGVLEGVVGVVGRVGEGVDEE
ncbi:uncharacterized protein SPPG_05175 [Spizellomyces punctatus DAOM BR117]|uniref:Tyrosinase copper-binding domain-containing protein n=1 Tax=Spizellomyces punctatus (strain DAOM BR117) TaxID=645134 RepID=A0A0L0HG65_SPIPD|nr:uncharacterized protein SPPG_05175 [Spizellomyces punctatus DAOM BR117]KNC99798.1 hypothetical protein SPPG_05175 [Spizellomyces punctatus DAOM BR117]|eukprot:XP_016607838.1 hypothetical protein SPPG_05175 [Spizellomyces punctatus DAOM BR117]